MFTCNLNVGTCGRNASYARVALWSWATGCNPCKCLKCTATLKALAMLRHDPAIMIMARAQWTAAQMLHPLLQ